MANPAVFQVRSAHGIEERWVVLGGGMYINICHLLFVIYAWMEGVFVFYSFKLDLNTL